MTVISHTPPSTTPAPRYRTTPAWSNHMDIPAPVADRRLSGDHWWDPTLAEWQPDPSWIGPRLPDGWAMT